MLFAGYYLRPDHTVLYLLMGISLDGKYIITKHVITRPYCIILTNGHFPGRKVYYNQACYNQTILYYTYLWASFHALNLYAVSITGECMWIHLELIKEMKTFCKRLFPVSSYGAISIPSYPCGTIGFMMCSKHVETNFKEPLRIFTEEEKEKMKLRYYDEDVHRSAFVLPRFVKKVCQYMIHF